MIVWLFASIWHALVGLVLLAVFFVGAVAVLGHSIAKATAHDQATCDCPDCRRRRNVASKKRWEEQDKKRDPQWANDEPRQTNELWISTIELIQRGTGTQVGVKGVMYELMEVEAGDGKWLLYLKNLTNRRRVVSVVKYQAGHRKYWKLGDGWFS